MLEIEKLLTEIANRTTNGKPVIPTPQEGDALRVEFASLIGKPFVTILPPSAGSSTETQIGEIQERIPARKESFVREAISVLKSVAKRLKSERMTGIEVQFQNCAHGDENIWHDYVLLGIRWC